MKLRISYKIEWSSLASVKVICTNLMLIELKNSNSNRNEIDIHLTLKRNVFKENSKKIQESEICTNERRKVLLQANCAMPKGHSIFVT